MHDIYCSIGIHVYVQPEVIIMYLPKDTHFQSYSESMKYPAKANAPISQ
jgi:hypothetical protein